MITITCGSVESYDEKTQEFVLKGGVDLTFEHSLKAISAWEDKWKIPFLSEKVKKTGEQVLDYFEFMCLSPEFRREYVNDQLVADTLLEYMKDNSTATKITSSNKGEKREMTSELIYAYMAITGVPFECDTWNIWKLITLLNTIGALQSPPKKMTKQEIFEQNARINAERRKQLNTKG